MRISAGSETFLVTGDLQRCPMKLEMFWHPKWKHWRHYSRKQ